MCNVLGEQCLFFAAILETKLFLPFSKILCKISGSFIPSAVSSLYHSSFSENFFKLNLFELSKFSNSSKSSLFVSFGLKSSSEYCPILSFFFSHSILRSNGQFLFPTASRATVLFSIPLFKTILNVSGEQFSFLAA